MSLSHDPVQHQSENLRRLDEVTDALRREWKDLRETVEDLKHTLTAARAAILANDNETLHRIIREARHGGTG